MAGNPDQALLRRSAGSIGFIGLGHMGAPMARNLVAAGVELMVWNRSEAALSWFRENGVAVAASPSQLFQHCSTVILMLANGGAIDEVLGRGMPELARK